MVVVLHTMQPDGTWKNVEQGDAPFTSDYWGAQMLVDKSGEEVSLHCMSPTGEWQHVQTGHTPFVSDYWGVQILVESAP